MLIRALFGLMIVVAIVGLVLYQIDKKPKPDEVIKQSRLSYNDATTNQAAQYAPEIYKKAKSAYDSAMSLWIDENQKNLLQRDYTRVVDLAQRSIVQSKMATQLAIEKKDKLEQSIESLLGDISKALKLYEQKYHRLPPNVSKIEEYTKSQLLSSQASIAMQNRRLLVAHKYALEASRKIEEVNESIRTILLDYFQNENNWEDWINSHMATSKKKKSDLIVVDKFAHKCFLYRAGVLKQEFDVELGPYWIGDKQHEGDKRTPEGQYQVIAKKDITKSKYHRALKINYPNQEDIARFEASRYKNAKGKPGRIGGLIEIHGEGGKGADWTEGCVALKNSDMDKLFASVEMGTPVVIVGSIKKLNEINK